MAIVKLPLQVVDYVIFSISILISLGIGIYHAVTGGKQRTTSEFFVGDRKMSVLPVALSMMVTFESSILMIGKYLLLFCESHVASFHYLDLCSKQLFIDIYCP